LPTCCIAVYCCVLLINNDDLDGHRRRRRQREALATVAYDALQGDCRSWMCVIALLWNGGKAAYR